ncbi:MAG: aminotransferase class I/II-fold pyridoxal phosphate-dependent enzyme [Bacteroidota bacterium]
MAKIRHNNFLDTVDEVISDAKREGIVHLYTEGDELNGRKLRIKGNELFHFGTTGYLGLEQDMRLKNAAIRAILKFGTQFPLSKTYISHPLYHSLEQKVEAMYGHPVIITKNSTLGHLGVIPVMVRDEDGVIVDHQVHWSVQNACQILKTRGIPIEMIRHNNLDMLEDKIKELQNRCEKIWYMADGIYSMYGDTAPIEQLMALSQKYPQLHFYFDDVHGMSWTGKNGAGFVMSKLKTLPHNVMLMATLSKTFGASGAIFVTSDDEMHRKIKTFGGPLTFSAQLEPASVASALASAEIHLSDEIYLLQNDLYDRIHYFNNLLTNTDLPLVQENNCPVFYIGTGRPATGYNFVNRLMNEGYYVNLGLYPAVPVKNTGLRITVSRHNQKGEIKGLVEAMNFHYPLALEETQTTKNKVRRDFKMPLLDEEKQEVKNEEFTISVKRSIGELDHDEWDKWMGERSVFNWDGLNFLERAFSDNERPEHNYEFYYFIVKDSNGNVVFATFFTLTIWKEDLLAPESVSVQIEEKRRQEPYYMTSNVLSMGSLFTEGQHYYLDKSNKNWPDALKMLIDKIEEIDENIDISMLVMRDFVDDSHFNQLFHNQGFVKVNMPESCILEDLSWKDQSGYLTTLSSRSRKHFKKEIEPYEQYFDVAIKEKIDEREFERFFQLFNKVKGNNLGLNTFSFSKKLFIEMSSSPYWEFIVLYLKDNAEESRAVGVMFCFKNNKHTYVPSFIGMDYEYLREYQIYRQMLWQTIKRAHNLDFKKIDFGMTASFEKRKVGAKIQPKVAYVQTKDNFNMELMGIMQNN